MKKGTTGWIFKHALIMIGLFSVIAMVSCKDDDPIEDPIASFQYEISEDNFLQIAFTNFSVNSDTYSWNFGDGSTSTEVNPTHAYAEVGEYTVQLTATNSVGVTANFSESIKVEDPYEALTLLAGQTSKTWKLYREGITLGVGPDLAGPTSWWALENAGARPCIYYHEFTFNREGQFIFDDNGSFWGEEAVFAEPQTGNCFEATASNMANSEGADVSAWLSGTHAFEYNPSNNLVTLTGQGAWMGLPQLTTNWDQITPVNSKSFKIAIEERDGYDLMTLWYEQQADNGDQRIWMFYYASYSNPALEPAVVEEEEIQDDLEKITPNEMFITFAARDAANLATIDTVASASSVVFGVDDPTNAAAQKVGQFIRTEGVQYQELQFRAAPEPKNIQFDNFTKVKIDIYIPADTDFTTLQRHFVFGFADRHTTQEWWNSPVQFVKAGDDVKLGEWTTYEFNLTDVKAREDLDMIYLGMGGGGHNAGGTFYIRNLTFE